MNERPPRVSVVLPTYDAAEYVESALESLLDQTLESFEVLVIDDGSTDGTVDIVESFDDERLRVVTREEPGGGLPGALNHGIERARGEFVARQDADDRSHPSRLERQVDYLDDHPSVSMVGTSAHLLRPDGETYETRIVPEAPSFEDLREKNHFVHGSVMFRTAAVRDVGGYDTAVSHAEDYDLWLRLARVSPVRNLTDPLYELRMHDDSVFGDQLRTVKLHAAFARRRATGETEMTAQNLLDVGPDAVYEDLPDRGKIRLHRELAQEHLRYGRLEDARTQCWNALEIERVRPTMWALLGLAYTHPLVIDTVIGLYRRILNARARRHSA